jgi:hypothetical protein
VSIFVGVIDWLAVGLAYTDTHTAGVYIHGTDDI